MLEIPAGFTRSARHSPYLELIGPVYETGSGLEYRLGLRLEARHANLGGSGHGGMACSLLDVYLGRLIAYSMDEPRAFVTISLTTDYLGAAPIGSWFEAHGRIDRVGRRIAYSSGLVTADGKPVARGSGIFQILDHALQGGV